MTDVSLARGRRQALGLLLGGAALASLTGCASSPPPRAMVIVPSLPQSAAASPQVTQANPAMAVSLAPIQVPEHWQRRSVVHLRGEAELATWPNAIWAERVEAGLTRRLSQALRQRAPEFGWATLEDRTTPRRLLIDVAQLDLHAARGQLVAVLNWRLLDRQGRQLDAGQLSQQMAVQVGSAQEEAAALGLWLDAQAPHIAARILAAPVVSDTADTTNSRR